MQPPNSIFIIIIVLFSAIIHEVMHGAAADLLGDKTARYAGRLTLNPLVHLDPFGSIILPFLLIYTHSPIFFGYAKPVPYNPYNLRSGRWSEAIVAGAGPLSNLVIALIIGLLVRFIDPMTTFSAALILVVQINVMLALFNMIPVPPLDGSKVLEAFLPTSLQFRYRKWRSVFEAQPILGMFLAVTLISVLGSVWSSIIFFVVHSITGI